MDFMLKVVGVILTSPIIAMRFAATPIDIAVPSFTPLEIASIIFWHLTGRTSSIVISLPADTPEHSRTLSAIFQILKAAADCVCSYLSDPA